MNYTDVRHKVLRNGYVALFGVDAQKDSVAWIDRWKRMWVGDLFFEFSEEEKSWILYHEIAHQLETNGEQFRSRLSRQYLHQLEFRADLYAFANTTPKDSVSALERMKAMIEEGRIYKKHEIDHPLIDERIFRVKRIQLSF